VAQPLPSDPPDPPPTAPRQPAPDLGDVAGHALNGFGEGLIALPEQVVAQGLDTLSLVGWAALDLAFPGRIPTPVMRSNLVKNLESGTASTLHEGKKASTLEVLAREIPLLNTYHLGKTAAAAWQAKDWNRLAELGGGLAGGMVFLRVATGGTAGAGAGSGATADAATGAAGGAPTTAPPVPSSAPVSPAPVNPTLPRPADATSGGPVWARHFAPEQSITAEPDLHPRGVPLESKSSTLLARLAAGEEPFEQAAVKRRGGGTDGLGGTPKPAAAADPMAEVARLQGELEAATEDYAKTTKAGAKNEAHDKITALTKQLNAAEDAAEKAGALQTPPEFSTEPSAPEPKLASANEPPGVVEPAVETAPAGPEPAGSPLPQVTRSPGALRQEIRELQERASQAPSELLEISYLSQLLVRLDELKVAEAAPKPARAGVAAPEAPGAGDARPAPSKALQFVRGDRVDPQLAAQVEKIKAARTATDPVAKQAALDALRRQQEVAGLHERIETLKEDIVKTANPEQRVLIDELVRSYNRLIELGAPYQESIE